jgi:intracellular sulfur oxidation DsrE/DsrF family protein
MKRNGSQPPLARRLFLSRMGAGATALGAAAAMAVPSATAQSTAQSSANGHFEPARHTLDDWLDQVPSQHRCVFDTTTADGVKSAAQFAGNFFMVNKNTYNVENSEIALVIVARHNSTPFAYNDSIWAKYGAPISQQSGFLDPKTSQPPTTNLYRVNLESLIKQGARLAVCQLATRAFAGTIARATGGATNAIFDELAANLLSNSQLVPAGIVAVNRAQEHGYTFVHAV